MLPAGLELLMGNPLIKGRREEAARLEEMANGFALILNSALSTEIEYMESGASFPEEYKPEALKIPITESEREALLDVHERITDCLMGTVGKLQLHIQGNNLQPTERAYIRIDDSRLNSISRE
jgi:hypothetical protein